MYTRGHRVRSRGGVNKETSWYIMASMQHKVRHYQYIPVGCLSEPKQTWLLQGQLDQEMVLLFFTIYLRRCKRCLIHSNIRTKNTRRFNNNLNSSSVSALGRAEIILVEEGVTERKESRIARAGFSKGSSKKQLIPGLMKGK